MGQVATKNVFILMRQIFEGKVKMTKHYKDRLAKNWRNSDQPVQNKEISLPKFFVSDEKAVLFATDPPQQHCFSKLFCSSLL